MTHEFHHQTFRHPCPGKAGNNGHAAAMVAQMGVEPLDVVPFAAAQEHAPSLACPLAGILGEHAGERGPSLLQFREDGAQLGMDGNSTPFVALAVNKDGPFLKINAGEREARFGNAPAVADAKEEANGHPTLCDGQMAFPCDQRSPYPGLLLCGDLGLFLGLGLVHFQIGQGIARDKSTLDGLAHDATQESHLNGCRLNLWPAGEAFVFLAPGVVVLGERVCNTRGGCNSDGAEVAADEAPVHQAHAEGTMLVFVGEKGGEPSLHPHVESGPLGANNGQGALALPHAGQVEGLLPAQGIVNALPAAFQLPRPIGTPPNPPERGALSLVNASHEGGVTECNSGARTLGTLRGEVGTRRSLGGWEYFGEETMTAVAPMKGCNCVTLLWECGAAVFGGQFIPPARNRIKAGHTFSGGGVEATGLVRALLRERGDTQNQRVPDAGPFKNSLELTRRAAVGAHHRRRSALPA